MESILDISLSKLITFCATAYREYNTREYNIPFWMRGSTAYSRKEEEKIY